MKLSKAVKRDRKISKRRYGMRIDNRGIFLVTDEIKKKAKRLKIEREMKESLAGS